MPVERTPSTNEIAEWVSLGAGLYAVEEREKALSPGGNRTPTLQPVAHHYRLSYLGRFHNYGRTIFKCMLEK
jgi:hypothetical protein